MTTIHPVSPSPHQSLYRGQAAAKDALKTHWFPHYNAEYVQSQTGLKGTLIYGYSKTYETVSFTHSILANTISAVTNAFNFTFGWALRPMGTLGYNAIGCYLERIYHALFPINPINGQRQFIVLPRSIEKFLGDKIFYPLSLRGLTDTSELLPGTTQSIAQRTRNVLQRLSERNENLLNPSDQTTRFNYRVTVVNSSIINAFACPAGGLVVFSQIVKELQGAITSREIENTTVQFADGSHVTVDLSQVTLDDALAAILGHEMTHAAAHHTLGLIFVRLLQTILSTIGRIVLITALRSHDPTSRSEQEESNRQSPYDALNSVLSWLQKQLNNLYALLQSRNCEYEADSTGTYFAKQAGFNPLATIYLHEFFRRKQEEILRSARQDFEFLFSHPCGENRKRAAFASIAEFAPQSLQGRVSEWTYADQTAYVPESISPAFRSCRQAAAALG